ATADVAAALAGRSGDDTRGAGAEPTGPLTGRAGGRGEGGAGSLSEGAGGMSTPDLSAFAIDLALDMKAYVTTSITRAVEAVTPRVAQLEAELLALKAIAPQPGAAG